MKKITKILIGVAAVAGIATLAYVAFKPKKLNADGEEEGGEETTASEEAPVENVEQIMAEPGEEISVEQAPEAPIEEAPAEEAGLWNQAEEARGTK